MSRRSRIRLLITAGMVVVTAVTVLVVAPFTGRGRGEVTLSYRGMTNFVSPWTAYIGGKHVQVTGSFAVFRLENNSGRRILCLKDSTQILTPAGWQPHHRFGSGESVGSTNWLNFQSVLADGKKQDFLVLPISTNEAWRIRLACAEKPRGMAYLQSEFRDWRHNARNKRKGMTTTIHSWDGRQFWIESSAVNP